MPIQVVVAAALIAASLPLLWWAFASARPVSRTVAQNLNDPRAINDLREAVLSRSASERAVRPAAARLSQRARAFTPQGVIASLERRVMLAGRPAAWSLERVLVAKLALATTGALFGLMIFTRTRSTVGFLLWIGATALGYFAPDLLLLSRAQERQEQLRLELPDTMDQMTISVEAGLGFDAAMARAAQAGHGPFAEELTRTLQEIQVGVSRTQALRNLSDRTELADLRRFVLAVVQAEGYGIPIADVLRAQAAELRTKRRQRAEERALKIPVKVIFPLVLCILPTLFIVLLGPAAIRVARTFLGGS